MSTPRPLHQPKPWTARTARRAAPFILVIGALLAAAASCATSQASSVEVVARVDLSRYMGTWYEIARLPLKVQEGCQGTTATYTRGKGDELLVLNRCKRGDKLVEAQGKAWVVDAQTQAKLKVQFFWPFRGDYWILGLDEDYRWALVGSPDRRYMWVLSRTPTLSEPTLTSILSLARRRGFDLERLIYTPQPSGQSPQKLASPSLIEAWRG